MPKARRSPGASLALAIALAGPLQASALLARLQTHLRALLALQGADGLWRQVLDRPEAPPELTVTAMSLTSLALARRHGWLAAGAADGAITRAWTGLRSRIDAEGRFRDVCAGTPAGPTLDFYLQRPMINGRDDRAAAMVLMAALSMG
jgi:rhamnogalacturonyl hydrolase YesR